LSDIQDEKAADNDGPGASEVRPESGPIPASDSQPPASSSSAPESESTPEVTAVPASPHSAVAAEPSPRTAGASESASGGNPSDASQSPPRKKKKKKKKSQPVLVLLLPVIVPVVVIIIAIGGMFVYFNVANQNYRFGAHQAKIVTEGVDVSKVKPQDMQAFLQMQRQRSLPGRRNQPSPDFDPIEVLSGKEDKAWSELYQKARKSIDVDVDYVAAEQPLRQALAVARKLGSKRELYLSLEKLEVVLNVEKRYGAAEQLGKEAQSLLVSAKKKEAAAAAKTR
jgi:hypothetical protein